MLKWADYLISEVNYDHNHLVSGAKRHKQTEEGITTGEIVDRNTVSSDIKKGKKYVTIYHKFLSYRKGKKIITFRIGGNYYLRIDANKVELDNFGDLPCIQAKPIESDEDLSKEFEHIEELYRKISKLEKMLSKK